MARSSERFLIQAARARIGTGPAPAVLARYASDRRAAALVSLAEEHSAVGIVYSGLAGAEAVPQALASRLSRAYGRQLAHNHLVLAEMGRVLAALQNLDVMVVKGLALAALFYHDPGIRPTADIDIVIRRADFDRVASALALLEYEPKADYREKLNLYCHVTFEREEAPGVPVEAHWSLERDFPSRPDDGALWEDARHIEIAGVACRTLSPENHLLQAALHLAHHTVFGGYPSLLWLTDVALLTRQEDLDWSSVEESADRQGFARAVYLALALSERLLGGTFPGQVRGRLGPLSGAIPALVGRGLADRLPLAGVPAPVRQVMAASFQGPVRRRGRYLAKYWVKPALKAVGLRK